MDQDALAGSQPGQLERRLGGAIGDRHGGRFRRVQVVRLSDKERWRRVEHVGEAPGDKAEHSIARSQVRDPGSDLSDDPRQFEPRLAGVARVCAQRVQDVAEIETRRPHFDLHFAVAGGVYLHWLDV
jgi:hypothetical protein